MLKWWMLDKYVGISVNKVYIPQLCPACVIINAHTGTESSIFPNGGNFSLKLFVCVDSLGGDEVSM